MPSLRLTELKLDLADVPVDQRRAADAPAETAADRAPIAHPIDALKQRASQLLTIDVSAIAALHVYKRSFDARKANILAVYIVDVVLHDDALAGRLLTQFAKHPHISETPDIAWRPPAVQAPANDADRPIVIGFGPCGLFTALALAQMGLRPVVYERGQPVRQRTKDTWNLWRKEILNPESNVQFGEGGAGLFSDGKLYSQIKDPRHLGRKVMQEFVDAGAPPEIMYMAHPHIGTFKLVKVVEHMRETIQRLGGEIHFGHRVDDIIVTPDEGDYTQKVTGLVVTNLKTNTSETVAAKRVVIALGHSARDTFAMLYGKGVDMQAKPLSIGVRIEHPQSVIDAARWGKHAGNELLGAADYKLVHHAQNGRSVYSFCMCPGGTVVAATSEPGHVVTNGMSQYSRNERNANAGIVVGIDANDAPHQTADWQAAFGESLGATLALQDQSHRASGETHPLAAIVLQRSLERRAFEVGGRNYHAPGQLVGDFLANRPSQRFGEVLPSYKPGVTLGQLADVLPTYAIEAMREALPAFGKQIRGFDMADAVMTGVETRTSSPLRIQRNDHLQSTNTAGLFPSGEGAGFAGGILSAGVDGIKVAEAVAASYS